MLKHKTITITLSYLRTLGACPAALTALKEAKILPARISTDPDDNLGLALELTQSPAGANFDKQTCSRWLPWLIAQYPSDECTTVDDAEAAQWTGDPLLETGSANEGENDPTVAAQMLAMIADHVLTKQGK